MFIAAINVQSFLSNLLKRLFFGKDMSFFLVEVVVFTL
jgi:hypothetical protein